MDIHVHTKEAANERPHVHILKKGRPSENDLKIYLDTLEVDPGRSKLKPAEIRLARESVEHFHDGLMQLWIETHGVPAPRQKAEPQPKAKRRKSKLY